MVQVKARGGDMGRQRFQAGRAQELKLILRAMCVGMCVMDLALVFCSCVCFVQFGEEREGRSLGAQFNCVLLYIISSLFLPLCKSSTFQENI